MNETTVEHITRNPKFAEMVRQKTSFSWLLSIIMLVIYFGFILIIAFTPHTLGIPLTENSVTTIGIPLGLLVIISAFVLTGIYVRRANTVFDALTQEIVREARQ